MSDGPFRRTTGGGVSRSGGAARSDGPNDKQARYILIGMGVVGLLLLILVLPPISLLSSGGGGGANNPGSNGTSTSGAGTNGTTLKLPRVPDGYEALSPLYTEQDKETRGKTGPFVVSVALAQSITDARNLGLYTYQGNQWTRVANGVLQPGGSEVKGEVSEVPSNLAVLRRTTSAVQISGWLAPGANADDAALQAINTVNVLGYAPAADGGVSGAGATAPAGQLTVVPTVRATSPAEIDAVNAILASPQLRDAHVNALVQLSLQPGYSGVDLDYRNVNPARKADLTAFVTQLATALHQSNRTLTMTLPTPAKAGVTWDTGAYDWEALSGTADLLKLAPELDPSIYYARMGEVLSYLDPKVDLKKVSLIISRRSIEKGTDGLTTMSLLDALNLASTIELRTTTQITPGTSVVIVGKNIYQDDGATGISWDPGAFAVSFAYPGRGGQRTVWLENSLSVAFKLDLARRYGLGGVAFDDISADSGAPAIWDAVGSFGEGGSVDLVAPNSNMLRPTWKVQAGSTDQGNKGNIVWKAPAQPGAYDISLVVSDGVIRAEQKVVLEVKAAAATTTTPSTTGTPGTPRPTATATPRP
jgi:spore germination protein YaaH